MEVVSSLECLAAWDLRRGYVMGRCEPKTRIAPFGRLLAEMMEQQSYRSADRVFLVVDNGSSHRGDSSPNTTEQMAHLPI